MTQNHSKGVQVRPLLIARNISGYRRSGKDGLNHEETFFVDFGFLSEMTESGWTSLLWLAGFFCFYILLRASPIQEICKWFVQITGQRDVK